MINDLKIRAKIIKLSEENLGVNLHELGFGNGFLHMIPKAGAKKEKIDILDFIKIKKLGTSLVAQWLRICMPMQETQVQALVQEDPTCRGATKPVCHNY